MLPSVIPGTTNVLSGDQRDAVLPMCGPAASVAIFPFFFFHRSVILPLSSITLSHFCRYFSERFCLMAIIFSASQWFWIAFFKPIAIGAAASSLSLQVTIYCLHNNMIKLTIVGAFKYPNITVSIPIKWSGRRKVAFICCNKLFQSPRTSVHSKKKCLRSSISKHFLHKHDPITSLWDKNFRVGI